MTTAAGLPSPTNWELGRTLLREQGIRGLYRGVTLTAIRDSGYGAYFLVVSYSRHIFYV
jgi:solute carrier family 25 (mitochondrial carnitine/acylcarnitine transporter), member 20/29